MNDQVTYTSPGLEALGESTGWVILLAGLLVTGALVAAASGWRERRIAPRGWGCLLALRLTAIATTGMLLAGIEKRALIERERPSRVVLLVDRSASMGLPVDPATTDGESRQVIAMRAVDRLAESLRPSHAVRRAEFDVVVRYDSTPDGSSAAGGAATRLGDALTRVLEDHATVPLAAIVVASDGGWNSGDTPRTAAARAATRGTPIHTFGVGPLKLPPNAGLRDLAVPSQAAVGDPFRALVAVTTAGTLPSQRVAISISPLDEQDTPGDPVLQRELTVDEKGAASFDDLRVEAPGRYQVAAELVILGPDADPSDNRLTATLELTDEPTRVLLAASGPSRDYRFLRDQFYRDDQFTCDVLLQTAAGGVTQDADRLLDALPTDETGWNAYDALVAIDFDWRETDAATVDALGDWVTRRGGGFVFASAGVSTPACVRTGLPSRLQKLLPVKLRDDPLAIYAAVGGVREAQTVTLTPAGRRANFLSPPRTEGASGVDWETFEGFYSLPLPAEVKPGAGVLATLGKTPLFVEQAYGAGRVVYLASAETWRLRRDSVDWFTALHTGMLRRVTRGRLAGGNEEGTLLFDRPRYAVGDSVTLRYASRLFEASGSGQIAARVLLGDSDPVELSLAAIPGQAGVYSGTFQAERAGRLIASTQTPGGRRLNTESTVALPSQEGQTLVQDAATLRELAEATGGEYVDLGTDQTDATIRRIAAGTPSLAEIVTELGPPDERFASRLAAGAFAAMVGALVLEWLLRRMWRLA